MKCVRTRGAQVFCVWPPNTPRHMCLYDFLACQVSKCSSASGGGVVRENYYGMSGAKTQFDEGFFDYLTMACDVFTFIL